MSNRETGFSWQTLDAILQRGANKKDSAAIMDCSEDTIERRIREEKGVTFTEYREMKMAATRLKLVETILAKAIKGDNVALIFCLKNLCGWRDKQPGEDVTAAIVNNYANLTDAQLEERLKELSASRDIEKGTRQIEGS